MTLEEIEMRDDRFIRRLAFLAVMIAILWPLAACQAPSPPVAPSPPPPPPPPTPITHANLKYLDFSDGCAEESTSCVTVVPDPIPIWKTNGMNPGRAKMVKWWVDNSQKNQYYWEIEYKDPTTVDYIGPIQDIACSGPQHTKSKSTNGSGGTLTWYYQVKVWSCDEDGEKDACLCKTDPRVEILE